MTTSVKVESTPDAETPMEITDQEQAQIERANATTKTPIVFIHGLWLLPSSWDNWVAVFEEAGYVGLTPTWPNGGRMPPLIAIDHILVDERAGVSSFAVLDVPGTDHRGVFTELRLPGGGS